MSKTYTLDEIEAELIKRNQIDKELRNWLLNQFDLFDTRRIVFDEVPIEKSLKRFQPREYSYLKPRPAPQMELKYDIAKKSDSIAYLYRDASGQLQVRHVKR